MFPQQLFKSVFDSSISILSSYTSVHTRLILKIFKIKIFFDVHLQSLVLLTLLPLFDLFSVVVGTIAYGFFESGEPAIEAGNCFYDI